MSSLPTEIEFPPIMSIILTILTLILLLKHELKRFQVYEATKRIGYGYDEFIHINLNWKCDKIRKLMGEQFTPDFMYKLSKENLVDSLKKLIDCKILDFEKDKKYFNQFSEWENFNLKHPETFLELGNLMKFEEMTSAALESLPVDFILDKIEKKFDGSLMKKLPIKKILNYLITNESYLNIWKLFDEQVFNEISPDERYLLMRYLNYISNSNLLTDGENLLILLIRTENFLISSLISLKEGKLWNEDEDDWIERFSHVETILIEYLRVRRKLIARKDISDMMKSLIYSPISYKMKDAIKDVLIKKATVGVTITSILSNVLLMPKPIDPNIQFFDPPIRNLSIHLLKFYKVGNIIQNRNNGNNEIEDFIKDPLVLLEFLRSYSDDPSYILNVLKSVHPFDLLKTEKFLICEWIKKSLELGSPQLLTFIYSNYKKLVKSEIATIFKEAKKEEMIKSSWMIFVDSEVEIELKFLLILPLGTFETILYLDFIDHSENDADNIGYLDYMDSASFNRVTTKNSDLKFLDETYQFYLKESKGLQQNRLNIKFNGMSGQDTGGLCRHFLMIIFRILINEKFGLFHILNSGKVIPRTLLDSNILGFVGMLHGQALKSSLKVPWLIDFDYKNQPIKLCDLIEEFGRNSEDDLVPTLDDILNYLNDKYRLFHDRFDFSEIASLVTIDSDYLNGLVVIEQEFWKAGEEAYKWNLVSLVDREIVNNVDQGIVYEEILEMLKPIKSSEIDSNEFLNCFTFTGEAKDLIKRVFEEAIKADPQEMIPATLKFVSGSIELPPAGLASLNLVVNTFVSDERRLPQTSTCHKIINWTISSEESENELVERFKIAIKDTKGFELE
jgi:hypothetical protein